MAPPLLTWRVAWFTPRIFTSASTSAAAALADGVIVGTYIGSGNGWTYRDGAFPCVPLPDLCGSFNNLWRASSANDVNSLNVFTGGISPDGATPLQAFWHVIMPLAAPGKTRAAKVLSRPRSRSSRKPGMAATAAGKARSSGASIVSSLRSARKRGDG